MNAISSTFIHSPCRQSMKLFFIILMQVFWAFTTGCEGYRCGTGTVVDKITRFPLDSVYIEVLTGRKIMYTDSTGKFDVCNPMSGCIPDCRDISIRFSKAGYQSVTLENPAYEIVVPLER